MNKIYSFLPVFALLTACGPTIFVKEGASVADFNKDKRECVYEAARSTPMSGPFADPIMVAMERSDMQKMCLEARVWTRQ